MTHLKRLFLGMGLGAAVGGCVFLAARQWSVVARSRCTEICFRFDAGSRDVLQATREILVFHARENESPPWANSAPLAVDRDLGHLYRVRVPGDSCRFWIRCDFKPGVTLRAIPKFAVVTVNGKSVRVSPHSNFGSGSRFAGCYATAEPLDGTPHRHFPRGACILGVIAMALAAVAAVASKGACSRACLAWFEANWEVLAVAIVVMAGLSCNLDAPFRLAHDDNSALFSSFARSHLVNGYCKTFGQDFYTLRSSGAMQPYLHHPPAVALWLSLWFGQTGHDTPAVVRTAMGLVHLTSFALFSLLAHVFVRNRLGRFTAIAVFGLVPMSLFMGRMGNHQVPGLMFFLLGATAAVRAFLVPGCAHRHLWRYALAVGWAGVLLSSWHASIAAVSFTVCYMAIARNHPVRKPFAAVAIPSLAVGATAFLVPFLLAKGCYGLGENASEVASWLGGDSGLGLLPGILKEWCEAFRFGVLDYAFLPWCLFLSFASMCLMRLVAGRGLDSREKLILALACGNAVYACLFAKALGHHSYQLFYFLPAVGLASGVAVWRLDGRFQVRPWRKFAILLFFAILSSCLAYERWHSLNSTVGGYARKTVAIVNDKYL